MKINLTKLLDLLVAPPDVESDQTNAAYFLKACNDTTSTDNAYSFELEKESFSLKNE